MTPEVASKFNSYPADVKPKMLELRAGIMALAAGTDVQDFQETLKWGEPAYLVKGGSTVRIDWKPKTPQRIYLYFNCRTKLVETFRQLYFEFFKFEGNRAIKLDLNEPLPTDELMDCVLMAFRYHNLKHLPLLGAR